MENINKLEKCIERKKLSNDLNGLYNKLKFTVKNNNKNVSVINNFFIYQISLNDII